MEGIEMFYIIILLIIMNQLNYKAVAVALGFVALGGCSNERQLPDGTPASIPKIIFDTDMGPDYDDVGAITILHALADSGECEILATVSSDGHPLIAPTIEVFNRYFKRDSLPIGIPSAAAPDFTAPNGWNDTLVNRFAPELQSKTYPSAVSVYRKVLAAQPDNSVTIVTVGFLSNISDLLESPADEHSELNGVDLVKAKAKQWVAMAGSFPEGFEFNLDKHAAASVNALRKWPKPILFSGFEIGDRIRTGGRLAQEGPDDSPAAQTYAYNLKTYTKEGETNRQSWDQTAVLCAVREPSKYFYVNGPGRLTVREDGYGTWDPETDAGHYFVSHKYPYGRIAESIEKLMAHVPAD